MVSATKTILVIANKQNSPGTVGGALENNGFHLLTADNVKEGLDLFVRKHVDLVFASTEVVRTAGDYLEYFIKERTPDVPVIIMTEQRESPAKVKREIPCVDSTASKPFGPDAIRGIIRRFTSK